MRMRRACKITDLNWGAVPELVNRLERQSFKIKTIKGGISQYPDMITINNIDDFVVNIRENGPPPSYDLSVDGKVDDVEFYFSLSRGWNIHGNEYLYIVLDAPSPLKPLESIMELLGLTPDQEACISSRLEKTAFIAHRFDNVGNELADKLARFLELLGFSVATGRGFTGRVLLGRLTNQSNWPSSRCQRRWITDSFSRTDRDWPKPEFETFFLIWL